MVWLRIGLFWDYELAWQRVTRFSLKPKSFKSLTLFCFPVDRDG